MTPPAHTVRRKDPDDYLWRDLDDGRPATGRVYDYLLGGSHNFIRDRELARAAIELIPDLHLMAQANRSFLHRAVRYLVEDCGIRQLLDLGSGTPTLGNVHEIAQELDPSTRVLYVDNDPVAVAHSNLLLRGNPHAVAIRADVRNPAEILRHEAVTTILDLTQPVGLLLVAVLHFIADEDDPRSITRRLSHGLCPGSYLAISHGVSDARPQDSAALTDLWAQTDTPLTLRTRPEIEALLTGWELIPPGLVWAPQWRPDWPTPEQNPYMSANLVGVARQPETGDDTHARSGTPAPPGQKTRDWPIATPAPHWKDVDL